MKKISNLWLRLFAISVVMVSWSSLCIADTFIVTHTYNTGSGSLRWAIEQTNNNPGPDTIRFNIPADDEGFKDNVWTIKPLNNLPTITDDSTVIDGCTQTINQGDKNSDGPEIVLDGRENEMNGYGLEIQSSGNEVSGLVISGFSGEGIRIQRSEAHDNRIRGNYIGTNASGSDTLGNDDGIIIYNHSAHNIIGGKGENEGNVISGNHDNGIFISSSDSNVVIGNRIGTDATGMLSLGNGQNGIYIGYYCTGNIIGGSKTGERNVLSGNGYDGIYVYGRQIRGNIIQGNFIGVDINGTSALGNYLGIALGWEVSKTVVGGLAPGEGNVISGNKHHGIMIYRDEADSNRILGNFIGTGADGKSDIGNEQYGIELSGGTQRNQIGPSNVIRYNGWSGIAVSGTSTLYNRITQNSISDNFTEGIHLLNGGNGEFEQPVITGVGSIEGTAPANSIVEIFSDPGSEGLVYHATVVANVSGHFTWTGTPYGPYVTATATDENGNTSEFSEPKEVWAGLPDLVVINTEDSGDGSLRWAIEQANGNTGPDTIRFNIPADDEGFKDNIWTIKPTSALPVLSTDGMCIDGTTQAIFIGGDPNPQGPEIVVDGSLSGANYGFVISGLNNELRRLVINHFTSSQIIIGGDSNKVFSCFIGPDAVGEDRVDNNAMGVWISGGSHNVIGGESEADRNVISGNGQHGIAIYYGSNNNQIIGNYIGINSSGTDTLGNRSGVCIAYGSGHNTVGPMNVISGNTEYGIRLAGTDSDSNRVVGNYIGMDRTGSYALANRFEGIFIWDGPKYTIIGGENGEEGNIISGNGGNGIEIKGEDTDENRIACNRIGTNVSGTNAIKNSDNGIVIYGGAKNNVVGPGNIIAFNGNNGVFVIGSGTLHNTITQNSIRGNGGLGIKNWDGGNAELSPPVITDLGSVSGTAPPNSIVEIFSDSLGEGMQYEVTVLANGSGNFTWSGTPEGPFVTATATDADGNTSEFSEPKEVVVSIPGWIVTNTDDTGEGSLRWAIEQANSHIGPDTIRFNIPTDDEGFKDNVWTIKPMSNLPTITDDSTVIDGFSQTVNQGDTNTEGPEIMLDGRENSDAYGKGLRIHSAENEIKGLVISGFIRGIFLTTNKARNNRIVGNYIGTDASGSNTLGNSVGVTISSGAKHNRIGGTGTHRNIISGNSSDGVIIYAADSNIVCGNWIGLDATGRNRISNLRGIEVSNGCKFNQIGPDNIVSGSEDWGIEVRDVGTDSNWVRGNWIGLDATGQDTVPNLLSGIYLSFDAAHNIIGGSSEEDRNVISGNIRNGLTLYRCLFNVIRNNYIGTDTSGSMDLGNLHDGVYFGGSGIRNIFCDNIISGNDSCGIVISGSPKGNIFRGNKIGVQADGLSPLPNQFSGIRIQDGATADTIGPGNQIWYNGQYGILLKDSAVTRITITQNSIAKNESGGISLQNKANEGINVPVIAGQNPLTGIAIPKSTVEIFSDSLDQGQIYEATVQADGSGNWTYIGSLSGPRVTATATDPDGNTSEFSDDIVVSVEGIMDLQIPERFFLSQNYPNPFNSETTIQFNIKEACRVLLSVYNLLGQELVRLTDKKYQSGRYEVTFNGTGLSSGIYLYKIQMGDFQAMKKMVVLE